MCRIVIFQIINTEKKEAVDYCKEKKSHTVWSASFKYYVKSAEGEDIEVCQKAFKSIYAIGTTWFQRIRKRQLEVSNDQRGKHGNLNQKKWMTQSSSVWTNIYCRFPEERPIIEEEKIPIKCILLRCWTSTECGFVIYKSMNLKKSMQIWNVKIKRISSLSLNIRIISIYLTEHNIGFGNPRSDTCLKCDQLKL